MARLSLFLLGPPRIECDGVPVKVDTRKAIALLAYVAITGESHRRDSLVNLLWPEYDPTRGRAALRRTLSALRKALTGDWLDIDRETVGLSRDAAVWLDVDQFRGHLAECFAHGHPASQTCPACIAPLAAAVDLYRGDFLSGFSLKDSFNFDDWQFFQTDGLRRELAGALERLVHCHTAQGAFEPAIGRARQWLALDRLDESAHCQLMRLYAWSGQRSAALRQYEECTRILESALSLSPQESTTELYKAIQQGRSPAPPGAPRRERLEEREEREAPPLAAGPPFVPGEEKRIVTVVCADMGGSFRGMGDVGPEDEASLARRFLRVVERGLVKYGGQVDRVLGERVLGVFGVAQTSESDPELAIRAAIEIRKEAGELGLSVSAGINTGEVYLSGAHAESRQALTLMGTVVDLAARLTGKAHDGQILVGESTYRLTRRAFGFTPLSLDIKGMETPVAAYQVDRLLPQPRKARGIEGLRAELIGRDGELGKLKQALASVLRGRGHMVSLIGGAGVGKSRLVAELKEVALTPGDGEPKPLWLEGRCLELGVAASYAPFSDIFRAYFAWRAQDDDRSRRERIASSLLDMAERGHLPKKRAEEIVSLLGNLLSIQPADEWEKRLESDSPEQIQRQTFLAVHDFLLALAARQPIVLVFEDLHWADSLSLDLITLLMESLHRGPLLLLCVYRPERGHRCSHLGTIAAQKCGERYTELRLRELTHQQSQRLVESLLTTEDLPPAVGHLVLNRSQGNPFFIEEVVRSLIDAGVVYRGDDRWRAREGIISVAVPESVKSVILSRVDHLNADLKHVLQTASVIGRVFRRSVLERAAQQQVGLENGLWELEDRALVYRERAIPEEEYSFKHVLTQETVYQNIPRHQRQAIHQQVAEALEALYPDGLNEYCEQLAYHYDRSGDVERAVAYLLKAGEKAKRSHANEAAIAHLTRGLELIETLPETPERTRRELDLQIALGIPLVLTRGHVAPEVEKTYARARELCQQIGDTPRLFHVLLGLRRFYLHRGQLQTAYELGEQLLSLAQTTGDPVYLSRAHMMHAETLYHLGEFSQVWEHSERGIAFCDPQQRPSHVFLYGNDTRVGCWLFGILALWHLGYPERALNKALDMLALAQELAHPFTRVCALYFAAVLHQLRREAEAVQERTEPLLRIAREQGFALYLTWGTVLRGWALAEQGEIEKGIAQTRQGLSAWRAMGAGLALPHFLSFLAQAYERAGKIEEGLDTLSEALGLVDKNGERCWEAELNRLRGELLLLGGKDTAEAEACFHDALAVARRQGARSWELRAAVSLGRLWKEQEKRKEARALIQGVYGWFAEGSDTVDLKEAKTLLDALA